MAKIDRTYHDLLEKILKEGYDYKDESRDVICKQISSYEFRHNLQTDGFPAITTKKLYWKGVVGELIWFLRGDTNIKYLVDNNIHIWDKDAYNYYLKYVKILRKNPISIDQFIKDINNSKNRLEDYFRSYHKSSFGVYKFGDLGRVYGSQWKNWTETSIESDVVQVSSFDQFSNLIQNLKDKPMSRRHIVTSWNPAELKNMSLPPCHWSFEILPRPLSLKERNLIAFEITRLKSEVAMSDLNVPKYAFDLKWHQRSVDTFLGLPFNIASYGLLANIIGKLTNMIPNELIGDLSNVHVYEPHIQGVKEQLYRNVNEYTKCEFNWLVEPNQVYDVTDDVIDLMEIKHFQLENYESYPAITVEMLAPI